MKKTPDLAAISTFGALVSLLAGILYAFLFGR